jgi:hypothetical protein
MTLSTDVYIVDEIDVHEVFRYAQGLVAKYDAQKRPPEQQAFDDDQDTSWDGVPGQFSAKPGNPWTIANKPGQNLPAWLMLHYRPGEPLRTPEQAAEHDEDCNIPGNEDYDADAAECTGVEGYAHRPACWLNLDLDTAYGYDQNGMGCGDLHAALVAELGEWLTERGIKWLWRNEFTGEIHDDPKRLVDLCSGGFEAKAWFRTSVLPAIVAHAAGEQA